MFTREGKDHGRNLKRKGKGGSMHGVHAVGYSKQRIISIAKVSQYIIVFCIKYINSSIMRWDFSFVPFV